MSTVPASSALVPQRTAEPDALPDPDPTLGDPVLDNPAWHSLTGAHERFAERVGSAARYRSEVAGFVALADPTDPRAWADLLALVGPGVEIALPGSFPLPAGWELRDRIGGVQLVDVALEKRADPAARRLGEDDVPDMLDLIARTQPGPFRERTIELGGYLGIHQDGRLVAMAGERLHPAGWTEISAVCTDPGLRGRGLATRLVRTVAAGIAARGERAFLHASATNTAAIRLYLALGFRLRQRTEFRVLTTPSRG
jgi:ribosomal protein S18 acetylase RimI-like enzyme